MKSALQIVNDIADFYCTSIEIEIFDCHSEEDLEELMTSEMDYVYDFEIDVEELENLAFEASKNFMTNRDDTDWLQECIIRTQQLDFLKDLRRVLYDLNVIFQDREIDIEDESDHY